jgi:hypothetical protein
MIDMKLVRLDTPTLPAYAPNGLSNLLDHLLSRLGH